MWIQSTLPALLVIAALAPNASSAQDLALFFKASLWTLDLPDSGRSRLHEQAPRLPEKDWSRYFSTHPALLKMNLGIELQGSVPLSRNPSKAMVPASVQKIFTAATALRILGADARFENRFIGKFHAADGTLTEPRLLVSGDPTWGHEAYGETQDLKNPEGLPNRLDTAIRFLRQKGVVKVVGPLVVESLRPGLSRISRPQGWRKSWELECMASLPTEFIASANCGLLQVTAALGNRPAHSRWLTEGVSVPVRLKVSRSQEGGNSVRVVPEFDSRGRITAYEIRGFMTTGSVRVFSLPVHQGLSWAKNSLLARLKRAGITYEEPKNPHGTGTGHATPEVGSLLGEPVEVDLSSAPLIDVLRTGVQLSLNGVLDRVFHELGLHAGADADLELSREAARLVGAPDLQSEVRLLDGSGLNLENRIRADFFHRYLDRLRFEPYFSDFLSTLAVAGKSGTLLSRPVLVASSSTYGKIFAKTGTLTRVVNLAGYFIPGEGATPEPFVILSESDFDASRARGLIDGIVVNFAGLNARL
jgi:D-alanyl-D-alanine carboxypeptidase/D-alanyl-D-alanine-endopeptidase (penicillin-binding protein 4)